MNVYRIEATHYWLDEETIVTFHVIAPQVSEALVLWRQENGLELQEPDSIACLGEAILPAQEIKEEEGKCLGCGARWGGPHGPGCPANPATKAPMLDPISGLSRPVPSVAIQCQYCGAMNSDAYRGPCPQCPPGAMRRKREERGRA